MAAPSKLPINPTSGERTALQYMLMILMAVNYLLDNNPRHVQYKKAQKAAKAQQAQQAQQMPAPNFTPGPPHNPTTPCPAYMHYLRPSPANPKTRWPYPRPTCDARGQARASKRWIGDCNEQTLTKPQMRDAWMRMRAATRVPFGIATGRLRRRNRVRWGRVEIVEYEVESESEESSDCNSTVADVSEQELWD